MLKKLNIEKNFMFQLQKQSETYRVQFIKESYTIFGIIYKDYIIVT